MGVQGLLLASLVAGVRVVPRAVGGWGLGRDTGTADPSLGSPRRGRQGRQESVRVRVSQVTDTRYLWVRDTLDVGSYSDVLAAQLYCSRFRVVEGVHEHGLGPLSGVFQCSGRVGG